MQNEAYRTDSHMFEMHVTSLMQEDSSRMQEEEQKKVYSARLEACIAPIWLPAMSISYMLRDIVSCAQWSPCKGEGNDD